MQTFMDQIREAVRQAKISRYAMSKQTGIAESNLSRFVHGERGLSEESLNALAAILGLRVVGPKPTAPKSRKGR